MGNTPSTSGTESASTAAAARPPRYGNGAATVLWGVFTTINRPSPAALALLRSGDHEPLLRPHLVVVGDKHTFDGPWRELAREHQRLTYLSSEDQAVSNLTSAKLLKWSHFGRKNLGYLYAVWQGAQWVFDFDDVNVIQPPGSAGHTLYQSIVTGRIAAGSPVANAHAVDGGRNSEAMHLYNPYPDFLPTTLEGKRAFAWPRGFPLDHVNDNRTFGRLRAGPPSTGVSAAMLEKVFIVQSLADHAADVDATYRMTRELPLSFERSAELALLPPGSFAPLNAQVAPTACLPSPVEGPPCAS